MSLILYWVKRFFLLRIAALGLLFAGTDAGAYFYGRYRANEAVQSREFPRAPHVSQIRSLVVVAPHCDDETLGAGGLIHQAVRAGARVRVIFLTNGDGFPLAVSREYRKLRPSRRNYLQFAARRQAEAIAALAELGVPRERVTFLGYPDRGLQALWKQNWRPDQPYRSPFTGRARNPYANSPRPGTPYCGSALLEDLRRILREEAPTDIAAPHPGDDHPDHWAGHCFTVAALRADRLRQEGQIGPPAGGREPRLHTYLVHRGDWPVPQGLHREARLVPPSALLGLDTRWGTLPLDEEAREAKARALGCYRSQMAVMRRFLQSFIRADELFGAVSVGAVPFVTSGEAAPLLSVIADCGEDTLLRELNGSVDLIGLSAAVDGAHLRLRMEARAGLSRRARYRVRLHPLGADAGGRVPAPLVLTFRAGRCDRPDVRCRVRGDTLEAEVPLAALGPGREFLLGAETELARVIMDRVCWRALRLPERAWGWGG